MSHIPYFITLKPTGAFYFGSEQNFVGGENYFAVSRQFPQQSTLLGVLRYKILEANNMLSKEYGKKIDNSASSLIGLESFVHDTQSNSKEYGVISHLSALTLYDGSHFYFAGNRDRGFKDTENGEDNFQLVMNGDVPNLMSYDIKTRYPPFWVGVDNSPLPVDDIFKAKTQVGIYRTTTRFTNPNRYVDKDEEKGFYKKTSWIFNKSGMTFSYFAWLSKEQGDKLVKFASGSNSLTPIGGERSLFQMEVTDGSELFKKWKEEAKRAHVKLCPFHRVVLLSDSYVKTDDVYKYSLFAMASPVPFRFMASSVGETENYFAMEKEGSRNRHYLKKSRLFQLMEAGSIIYLQDNQLNGFLPFLKAANSYRQIGNNEFLIYKSDNSILYEPYQAK